jgi:hypothetical protein
MGLRLRLAGILPSETKTIAHGRPRMHHLASFVIYPWWRVIDPTDGRATWLYVLIPCRDPCSQPCPLGWVVLETCRTTSPSNSNVCDPRQRVRTFKWPRSSRMKPRPRSASSKRHRGHQRLLSPHALVTINPDDRSRTALLQRCGIGPQARTGVRSPVGPGSVLAAWHLH